MTFKDKLLIYIYNKSCQLEEERDSREMFMRFRSCDEIDYLESIIQKVRKDTFDEILGDIFKIMQGSDVRKK